MTPVQIDGLLFGGLWILLLLATVGAWALISNEREYRQWLRHQKAKDAWRERIHNG